MDLWPPHRYSATFLAQAAVAAVSMLILLGIRASAALHRRCDLRCGVLHVDELPDDRGAARDAIAASGRPHASSAAVGFGSWHICGHSQESANLGLQWHVIAVYAPSFFTGNLIGRFGASRVATVGLAWNFGFLGASALVLECHRPDERTRVQSLNDFIVFGSMAVGSFSSRGLLSAHGWSTVLWVSFLPLALSVVALALAMRKKSSAVA
jgi:hypothetical protein